MSRALHIYSGHVKSSTYIQWSCQELYIYTVVMSRALHIYSGHVQWSCQELYIYTVVMSRALHIYSGHVKSSTYMYIQWSCQELYIYTVVMSRALHIYVQWSCQELYIYIHTAVSSIVVLYHLSIAAGVCVIAASLLIMFFDIELPNELKGFLFYAQVSSLSCFTHFIFYIIQFSLLVLSSLSLPLPSI